MNEPLRPADVVITVVGACGWVAAGGIVARLFSLMDVGATFQAFLPAIVLCCVSMGVVAGLTAATLSTVLLWYYFVPPDGFAVPNFSDGTHLVVFLSVAVFVCAVVGWLQRSNHALSRENVELGYKVSLLHDMRLRRNPRSR